MIRLIKLIIWLTVIGGAIFAGNYHSFTTSNMCIDFADGYFEVKSGDTFETALSRAYPEKLFTKIYLKRNVPDFGLQVGKYKIQCGDISEFIAQLQNPINATDINLTFLEGWNIFDIDQYLTQKGLIQAGEFIAQAEKDEGYLYPDTYAINPNNFSVGGLIQKMKNNFENKTEDLDFTHEDIILASIIEKEERNPEERPTVAGILKKRLDEGWKIGADITVCYPYKLTAEECKLSVTKYLYEVNDYNTRQKVGLPAGPIGNPSLESIQAVVHPKTTPYYYYLHDTQTGQIYYGRDNSEHERNKRAYLR